MPTITFPSNHSFLKPQSQSHVTQFLRCGGNRPTSSEGLHITGMAQQQKRKSIKSSGVYNNYAQTFL